MMIYFNTTEKQRTAKQPFAPMGAEVFKSSAVLLSKFVLG
jgi:hypothetical protein